MQQYWITLKSPHHLAPYEWLGRGAGFWAGREVKAQGSWLRTLQRKASQQEAFPLLSQVKWGSWDGTIPEGC